MTRKHKPAPGEFYHVYNRGVEKRDIFMCQADYERFMGYLYLCNSPSAVNVRADGKNLREITLDPSRTTIVDICAHSLMPNHFHLLLYEKEEGGISTFMQKLGTGYTSYFNKRNGRTGGLFEGTYKASWVDDDRYLSHVTSYIHINPISLIEPEWKENGIADKERALRFLKSYPYSSFIDYCGVERVENCLIRKGALPMGASAPEYFEKMVSDWLSYKG